MASKTSVRQMLNDKGIDNNRIGWNNGAVTVDNQNFMKPTNVYQGTSYSDQPTFNQAFSTYQNTLQPQQSPYQGSIFKPAETDMTWQQRIPYYAQNPEAGQAEVQRAQQALGVYKAMGDTAKAQAAEQWLGTLGNVVSPPSSPQDTQVQQLMNQLMSQTQQPRVNPQDAQVQQLINSLMRQTTTREPFDPYSSPEFAAQEARSQRAAQEGIRASQEALGTAGFGRSTVLGERAQNIQGEQEEYLRTQVIPQIIAQNEARRQQELQNQMAMLDPMMAQQGVMDTRTQQELQNQMAMLSPLMQQQGVMDERQRFEQQFGYQKERDIAGDIQFQQQFDYQKARDAIADERYKLEFDEDVRRYGEQFALDKAIKQGQLNVSRYNAQTSRMRQDEIKNGIDTGIDEYDLDIINQLANDQGIDYRTATNAEIRSFVARLKSQHGWDTQQAKDVESYMIQKARNIKAMEKENEGKVKEAEEKVKEANKERIREQREEGRGIFRPDFGQGL